MNAKTKHDNSEQSLMNVKKKRINAESKQINEC